ncbi:MAG: 3-hydroxyacyl-ACP dehydratase FabZ [Verrucomicrobia bacterium]|jgi:beta-hydroxyacyl-ACP dehydratase FabZ|nr:3-hydroxyacyl-ACP dehydratase FabZ [Verrucomicrobiota bacterium]
MPTLEIEEIMKLLPHRYPFLLVDRIVECDDEKHIVGVKNVTINEPFFQGHFPGLPVMPGVLQLEAMAQTAGILLNRIAGNPDGVPFFMGIDGARFRKVVKPGDQLRIEIDITKLRSKLARFKGRVLVNDQVASEAEMMCMIGAEDGPK